MLLTEILSGINCVQSKVRDTDIENITAKAEEIGEKTLFILYKGVKFDNTANIRHITDKKPTAILTDQKLSETEDVQIVLVENARLAYAYAIYNFYKIKSNTTKFYAVTGSNGKTTTATMLYRIFRKSNIKCGFIGTGKILINDNLYSDAYYSMTTPDPEILYPVIKKMQDAGCEKIVMEVSSHALALHKVAPLKYECSLFTNLSSEHLDFHKTIEEYYSAKKSIFKQSKIGIFNTDDYYSKRAFEECGNGLINYSVGIKNDADAMAKEISLYGINKSSYIYRESQKIFKINLNLGGEYNISNSLMAAKCALISGIDTHIIKTALEEIRGIEGRCEVVCDTPMIIIDYAHTDEALETVLKFIKTTKNSEQKLFSLFGCGGERDKEKRPRMARISEKYSDFTIITSDNSRNENPKEILKEIEAGFTKRESYSIIESRADAIENAILNLGDKDLLMIIGKGHERYNIDLNGYHDFDEREIIKKALQKRKNIQNENKNRNTANTFFDK